MMMRVVVLCTVALAFVTGMPVQSQSFTLKQALSAPFPSDLIASPPDEIHGFLLQRSWLAAYTAEADFFQRHLMSPRPATTEQRH